MFINVTKESPELHKIISETRESNSFTYYQNRSLEVVDNHLLTLVSLNNRGDVTGYGHLDFEKDIWLGIYVLNEYRGNGIAKKIMNELIFRAKKLMIDTIKLSVHKDNKIAIRLYSRYNFTKFSEDDSSYYMKIKL